jgi:hypothetical protein
MSTATETSPSVSLERTILAPSVTRASEDASGTAHGTTWDWWALLFGLGCLLLLGTMQVCDLVQAFLSK